MKELSIAEKAKRYDVALTKARNIVNSINVGLIGKDSFEAVFPELKEESEDGRIKKEIINIIESYDVAHLKAAGLPSRIPEYVAWLKKQSKQDSLNTKQECLKGIKRVQEYQDLSDWEKKFDNIASMYAHNKNQEGYNESWYVKERAAAMLYHAKKELEKQGEQKPTNKVMPKFKEGDWVVYNRDNNLREIIQVYDIRDGRYYFNDNVHFSWSIKECDEKSHLWTIQDAKDGDVLACESGWTCIFKTLVNDETFSSYCFMDNTKWFCETGSESHTLNKAFMEAYNGNIYPATKEQRDLLFTKMKEAGYEWDTEKKELKKIEQKPAENKELTEFDKAVGVSIGTWNPKTPEQIQSVKAVSKKLLKLAKKQINDEQRPAWSEEDKEIRRTLIKYFEEDKKIDGGGWFYRNLTVDEVIDWLKSLRPQSHWKPSKEQIMALRWVLSTIPYNMQKEEISGLLDQIKDL